MRRISRALEWMSVALATAGAGCSGGANCPSDYPVERDGYCYRADGGEGLGTDAGGGGADGGGMDAGGGGTDAGESVDGGGGGIDAGPLDAAPPICTGTHPLVMGTRRYCESGDCYCGDPENCFPEPIAAACCNVGVMCGDDGGAPPDGGGVICTGTHPLVMGSRRYCESGDCYCADPDSCFPSAIASACCGGAVVCE